MDDLEEKIENVNKQISKLNTFIALSLRRSNISKELGELTSEAIKTQDILTRAHSLMQLELNNFKNQYEEVMSEMRRKQILIMAHIIKEKQKQIEENKQAQSNLNFSCGKSKIKFLNSAPQSSVKLLGQNLMQLSINQTPKIKISEYKESPLVKRKMNPIPFEFEEFDVTITQHQFDTIPKYMCGRESLDQLNCFLKDVIIPCFNEKYKLVYKERKCVKNLNDLELWKLYNDQASCLPNRTFITPGDVTRKLNKMLDKKTQNRLVMLRHIGVLKEIRVMQTVFYVWSYDSATVNFY